MASIGFVFHLILLEPMVNFLIILNNLLFHSFGLAIIAFTIAIRVATFPLTLRQMHSTRAMQSIQPRINELQKKYSDPKRRQEEVMKVYKEHGVNPLGCLGPMVLQFPVLIALYSAVRLVLGTSPEGLERLSGMLYNWTYIQHAIPLQDHFLTIDLRTNGGESIPGYVLVALVAATTWAQTKTTVTVTTDEKARAQQQMMAYMMPMMFAFFALSFPVGIAIYWVVNSLVGIGFNILTYGLPILKIEPVFRAPVPAPRTAIPDTAAKDSPKRGNDDSPDPELRNTSGYSRSKRQNRRRRP